MTIRLKGFIKNNCVSEQKRQIHKISFFSPFNASVTYLEDEKTFTFYIHFSKLARKADDSG